MAIPALLQFAEYSNMTSIAVVLVGLFITTLFIYFFRVTDISHRSISIFGLKQRNMVKVQNPFVLSLQEDNRLQDGLMASLSALCPSTVVALWGPKINPLHDFILLPGSEICLKCLQSDENLGGMEPLHVDILKYQDPGKHKIVLPCPENVSTSSLGNMPRQRYPLAVLVLISKNRTETANANDTLPNFNPSYCDARSLEDEDEGCGLELENPEQSNSIIGLISVIHLKDEVVTQPSYVITQYVKTAGVALYSLQPLFMSSSTHNDGTPSPTTTPNDGTPSSTTLRGEARSLSQSPNDTTAAFSSSAADPSPSVQYNSGTNDAHPSSKRAEDINSERECVSEENPVENGDEPLFYSNPSGVSCDNDNCDNCPSPVNQLSEEKSVRQRILTQGKRREHGVDEGPAEQATAIFSNRTSSSVEFEARDIEPEMANLSDCVVCQSKPVACVILPCRHTSVCFRCLKLLDRCPMCRGSIDSYFMLDRDGYQHALDCESEEDGLIEGMQQEAMAGYVTMMLERLNAMLGFR